MDLLAAAGATAAAVALLQYRQSAPPSTPSPSRRPKLIIASCRELLEAQGGPTASYGSTGLDDGLLYAALSALGVPFDVRAWDDPSVPWSSYSLVLVRTTWDYSASEACASRFRAWLRAISDAAEVPAGGEEKQGKKAQKGPLVANHPRILSWNVHKRYLAEMMSSTPVGSSGGNPSSSSPSSSFPSSVGCVPAIPSAYVPAGCDPSDADLRRIAASRGWGGLDLLIKPCVGGGSRGCMRVRAAAAGRKEGQDGGGAAPDEGAAGAAEAALDEGQAFLTRHVMPRPRNPGAPVLSSSSSLSSMQSAQSSSPSASAASAAGASPTAVAALSRLHSTAMPLRVSGEGEGAAAAGSHQGVGEGSGEGGTSSRSAVVEAGAAAARKLADAAGAAASELLHGAGGRGGQGAATPAAAGHPHGVRHVDTGHAHDVAELPCDMMVQPYLSSVESAGEVSVVVLGGEVSHTVIKRPAESDFRTQEEHGGSPTAASLGSVLSPSPAVAGRGGDASGIGARREEGEEEAQIRELVRRVLDTARAVVEAREPPLASREGAGSPAHRDSLLPYPLPGGVSPLLVARLDFLRLTPAVAAELGPRALAAGSPGGAAGGNGIPLSPETTPLLLLELEVIEPCLFLAVDAREKEREGRPKEDTAAYKLARAVKALLAEREADDAAAAGWDGGAREE